VQALVPLAVGIGIGRDAAADAKHRIAEGVELDRPDRDVEFTAGNG
jgi:hypothetical protein